MLYNKNKVSKTNDKKILHKVGKQWKVVSVALLMAVAGGAVAASHTTANADALTTPTMRMASSAAPQSANSSATSQSTSSAQSSSAVSYVQNNAGSATSYHAQAVSASSAKNSYANKGVMSFVNSVNAEYAPAVSAFQSDANSASAKEANDTKLASSYSAVAGKASTKSTVNSLALKNGSDATDFAGSVDVQNQVNNETASSASADVNANSAVQSMAYALTHTNWSLAATQADLNAKFADAKSTVASKTVSNANAASTKAASVSSAASNTAKKASMVSSEASALSAEASMNQPLDNMFMNLVHNDLSSAVSGLFTKSADQTSALAKANYFVNSAVASAARQESLNASSLFNSKADLDGKSTATSSALSNNSVSATDFASYLASYATDSVAADANGSLTASLDALNGNLAASLTSDFDYLTSVASNEGESQEANSMAIFANAHVASANFYSAKASNAMNAFVSGADKANNASVSASYADDVANAEKVLVNNLSAAVNSTVSEPKAASAAVSYAKNLLGKAAQSTPDAVNEVFSGLNDQYKGNTKVYDKVADQNNFLTAVKALLSSDSNAQKKALTDAYGDSALTIAQNTKVSDAVKDPEAVEGLLNKAADALNAYNKQDTLSAIDKLPNLASDLGGSTKGSHTITTYSTVVDALFNDSDAKTKAAKALANDTDFVPTGDQTGTNSVAKVAADLQNAAKALKGASDQFANVQYTTAAGHNGLEEDTDAENAEGVSPASASVEDYAESAALASLGVNYNSLEASSATSAFSDVNSAVNSASASMSAQSSSNAQFSNDAKNGNSADQFSMELSVASSSANSAFNNASSVASSYATAMDVPLTLAASFATSYSNDASTESSVASSAESEMTNVYNSVASAQSNSSFASDNASYLAASSEEAQYNSLSTEFADNVWANTPLYVTATKNALLHSKPNYNVNGDKKVAKVTKGEQFTVVGLGFGNNGALHLLVTNGKDKGFLTTAKGYVTPTYAEASDTTNYNVTITLTKNARLFKDAARKVSAHKTLAKGTVVNATAYSNDDKFGGYSAFQDNKTGLYFTANTKFFSYGAPKSASAASNTSASASNASVAPSSAASSANQKFFF